MSTTVTFVDPVHGTIVIETERNVAISVGVTTDIQVGGRPVEEAIATEALQIRTPEPEDQTLKTTVHEDKPKVKGLGTNQPAEDQHECVGPYKLTFIAHSATQVRARCNSCGETVILQKNQYSEKALKRILEGMDGYKAYETPQEPQEAPKPEKPDKDTETSSELKLEGPAPRKKAIKTCAKPGCGKQFEGANRQMYCDEHKTGAGKVQAAAPDGSPTADTPLPEGMWWCVHHKSQQPHRSPDCPLIEDEPEKPATREEATVFMDPWDCGRCRIDGRVCKFHRGMEATGHKPPRR